MEWQIWQTLFFPYFIYSVHWFISTYCRPLPFPMIKKPMCKNIKRKKTVIKVPHDILVLYKPSTFQNICQLDVNRGIFALQLSLGNLLVRGVLKQSCFAIQRYFKQAAKNENAYE